MDSTTLLLIVCQGLTIVLLIISEALPMSASPYSGILQAMISILKKDLCENK
jgi:hypothetical protein